VAEITITIKDLPNGGVEVKANPSFETMAMMVESGHELTSAHGYTMSCLNVIRELSRKKEDGMIVKIPRLGKF
jgi:hypothetical protein